MRNLFIFRAILFALRVQRCCMVVCDVRKANILYDEPPLALTNTRLIYHAEVFAGLAWGYALKLKPRVYDFPYEPLSSSISIDITYFATLARRQRGKKKCSPNEHGRKLEHRAVRSQRGGSAVVVFAHFFLTILYVY